MCVCVCVCARVCTRVYIECVTVCVCMCQYTLVVMVFLYSLIVPDPPSNVQIISIGTTTAALSWIAPGNVDPTDLLSNTVECTESRFSLPALSVSLSSSATSHKLSELEEFDTYTCRVAAANGVGSSEFSSPVVFTTQEASELLRNDKCDYGIPRIHILYQVSLQLDPALV